MQFAVLFAMPPRQYSFWDRHARSSDSAFPTLLDAFLARTEPFEQFEGLDDPLRAQAVLEHSRRIEYWTDQARSAKRWMFVAVSLFAMLVVFMAMGVWVAEYGIGMLIILGIVAAAVTILGSHSLFQFYRLGRALEQQRCPDCAYNLTGTTPAIEPAAIEGAFIGPRCCPECGTPWPLLPAAIPRSDLVPMPKHRHNPPVGKVNHISHGNTAIPDLHLQGLDPQLFERLKAVASSSGRSPEDEVKSLLEREYRHLSIEANIGPTHHGPATAGPASP